MFDVPIAYPIIAAVVIIISVAIASQALFRRQRQGAIEKQKA
jgi:hypothetical protein